TRQIHEGPLDVMLRYEYGWDTGVVSLISVHPDGNYVNLWAFPITITLARLRTIFALDECNIPEWNIVVGPLDLWENYFLEPTVHQFAQFWGNTLLRMRWRNELLENLPVRAHRPENPNDHDQLRVRDELTPRTMCLVARSKPEVPPHSWFYSEGAI